MHFKLFSEIVELFSGILSNSNHSSQKLLKLSENPTDNIYGDTFQEGESDAAAKLAVCAASIDPYQGDRLLGLYGAHGQNGNLPISSVNRDYSTTGLDLFTVFNFLGQNPDTQRPLLPGETDEFFIVREVNENPILKDLSEATLEVLGKDQDGLWLMIEGGDIDWFAHDNNMENLIGTMLDFDKAGTSVINWINNNGGGEDNLLIVTADHDHYLTLNPNFPSQLQSLGGEALTNLDKPAEAGHFWGSDPNVKYSWGSHSNCPVPVYYQGAGSEVLDSSVGQGYESYGFQIPGISGLVNQSNIYQTMLAAVTGSTEKPLLQEPQTFYGDAGDNVVYIGADSDTIYANEGNNRIFALHGDSTVYAGSGDDLVYTGIGNDVIYVNEGNNTVFAGAGNDIIYAGSGDDQIYAGAGDDLIYANEGNNIINAGSGNDIVYATDNSDDRFILNAGVGSVTIYGFSSNDQISRGSGLFSNTELIFSISGNDTLISADDDLLATLIRKK